MKRLQAMQQETDQKINHNQQELQNAIILQEQRMQALADQQSANMQQVTNTVAEMQNRISQLDNTMAALNANMTAQFQQIMGTLNALGATQPPAPSAGEPTGELPLY